MNTQDKLSVRKERIEIIDRENDASKDHGFSYFTPIIHNASDYQTIGRPTVIVGKVELILTLFQRLIKRRYPSLMQPSESANCVTQFLLIPSNFLYFPSILSLSEYLLTHTYARARNAFQLARSHRPSVLAIVQEVIVWVAIARAAVIYHSPFVIPAGASCPLPSSVDSSL